MMEGPRRLPFELTLTATAPEEVRTGVLVVGAFANGTLPPTSQRVDRAAGGGLSAVLKLGDLGRTAGATLLLPNLNGVLAERVLLVSLGGGHQYGDRAFREALEGASRALAGGAAKDAAVTLAEVELPGRSLPWRLQQASRLLADGAYRFVAPRSPRSGTYEASRGVRRVVLLTAGPVGPDADRALRRGQAVAEGMALTRDLGNLPGSVCHPPLLAETAQALGREFGFEVEVLEREDMNQLGMGAALSMGSASGPSTRLIVMHYLAAGRATRPIVLIGGGVTFNGSGFPPSRSGATGESRFGLSGAAAVFGSIKVAARLRLPLNVIGIVPAVETLPGGSGARPGDVVTSMSGQTIEIREVDADGRLALADALTYAERFTPAAVIDVATLSGAGKIALGHVTSGLFANDNPLAEDLLKSGADTGDLAWRLPLFEEYEDQLRSTLADLGSADGGSAGAITAACFLERFAGAYKWAHLDIAGTTAVPGDARSATGRPVPLLSGFLIRRASSAQVSRSARAV
jgi:leucyl aminopeptidase